MTGVPGAPVSGKDDGAGGKGGGGGVSSPAGAAAASGFSVLSPFGLDSLGVTLGGAEATLEAADEPPEGEAFGLSPPPVAAAPASSSAAEDITEAPKSFFLVKVDLEGHSYFQSIYSRMASNVLWRMQH